MFNPMGKIHHDPDSSVFVEILNEQQSFEVHFETDVKWCKQVTVSSNLIPETFPVHRLHSFLLSFSRKVVHCVCGHLFSVHSGGTACGIRLLVDKARQLHDCLQAQHQSNVWYVLLSKITGHESVRHAWQISVVSFKMQSNKNDYARHYFPSLSPNVLGKFSSTLSLFR